MLNEQQVILAKLRLQSANEDYTIARSMIGGGHYKASNNRSYYAIFHAIRAVLALESKDFKKHGHAIGYFNKEYIHAGHFESHFIEIIKTIPAPPGGKKTGAVMENVFVLGYRLNLSLSCCQFCQLYQTANGMLPFCFFVQPLAPLFFMV